MKTWMRRWQVLGAVLLCGVMGCAEEDAPYDALPSGGDEAPGGGKADGVADETFPAAADLALIVPMSDADIQATSIMPAQWLDDVDDALLASDLGESIADESWEEDWRLVAGRFVTCSPLGKVADPAEVDRLCWPQVRLVFQPIVEDLSVWGIRRPYYADDRAIHALYRVNPDDPALAAIQDALGQGARLAEISPETLASFEAARDAAGLTLLAALRDLRTEAAGYAQIQARPEYFKADAATFSARLLSTLGQFCPPEALHELTAFSLPIGRNPAGANLWSFVAFEGRQGVLHQSPMAVHHAQTGAALFSIEGSEDVTTDSADLKLFELLEDMDDATLDAVERQVILDTSALSTHAERINDPYQTLVPNTSCSSCHRMTHLEFNFHNLSYFEDHGISVAPRVRRDVERDLKLARLLWQR